MTVHALVVGAGGFPARVPTEEEEAEGVVPLEPLPSVAEAVHDVAHALLRAGLDVTGPVLDPTPAEFRVAWETARERAGQDPLVVHFSGHAQTVGPVLYLAMRNTTTLPNGIRRTSVDADELLRDVEHEDGGPVLFLLDVCGGGTALTAQLAQRLLGVQSRNAWVIAACGAGEITYGARFSKAAATVIDRIARGTLDGPPDLEHVPVALLAEEIDKELERVDTAAGMPKQDVVCTRHDEASGPPAPFLRNRRHSDDAEEQFRAEAVASLRRYAERLDPRLDLHHFAARAAGTPDAEAFFFSGRRSQLERIEEWLGAPRPLRHRLLAVTGRPGAGKSALLGVTVCTVHPRLRPLRDRLGLRDFRPPPDPRLLAVHAHHLSTQDVVDSLHRQARALRPPRQQSGRAQPRAGAPHATFGELAAALRAVGDVTVVVDALDEADDPDGLLRHVLLPLTGEDGDPVPGCRVLIGTRLWPDSLPGLHAALTGHPERLLDLDAEQPASLAEHLGTYLGRLLDTDYTTDVTDMIAYRLSGSAEHGAFLTAAVYGAHLRRLSRAGTVLSGAEIARELPCDLPGMLDLDLRTLTAELPWTEAVLAVLARAAGQGMPAGLLHQVALALRPDARDRALPPRLRDTAEVLAGARFYLRTAYDPGADPAVDDGKLYSFFHRAPAEHLAGRTDCGAVLRALLSTVPAEGGARDWSRADRYLRRHAADHAVEAGPDQLDALLEDPSYLLHADPERLVRHLHRARGRRARMRADVYRQTTAHHPLRHLTAVRRDLLGLDAAVWRDTGLSDALASRPGPPPPPARPVWAVSRTATPARLQTLGPHAGPVSQVLLARAPGRDGSGETPGHGEYMVLSTGDTHRTRLSDPLSGRILRTLGGLSGPARAVAPAELADGRRVLVSGGEDGLLYVHDLRTGDRIRRQAAGVGPVRALVTVSLPEGGTRAVAAGHGRQAVLWDPDGTTPTRLDTSMVLLTGLATARLPDGTPVAIAVGEDREARVFDVRTGHRLRSLGRHADYVRAVATATLDDGTVVAVTGCCDGRVQVWNAADGRGLHTLTGHEGWVTRVVTGTVAGRRIAVSGDRAGRVLVWDLAEGRPLHEPASAGHGVITCLALGGDGERGWVVTGCRDGRVAVWELGTGRPAHVFAAHPGGVHGVDVALIDDRLVAVSGGADGHAVVWDVTDTRPDAPEPGHEHTDTRPDAPEPAHEEAMEAVAVAVPGEGPALCVAGGGERGAEVRDLATGEHRHALDDSGRRLLVRALATAELPDVGPVAVAGGRDGSLRMWELTHGGLVHAFPNGTARIRAVAAGRAADGRQVLVAGGDMALATVWDLATGAPLRTFTGHRGWLLAATLTDGGPTPGLAISGDRRGALLVWDVSTGREVAALTRSGGRIDAVATAELPGEGTVALSGGDGGEVLVWDLGRPGVAERLTGLRRRVTALATARLPGGRVLAVGGGEDRRVVVWDLVTRQELATPYHLPTAVSSIAACATGFVVAHEAGTASFTWCADLLAPVSG
ncbi:caspase family protein [Streptomyces violaceochromogenes]|uniref:Caspase family protein n=1 Tax=Streptomyces violaceochromogenes TaxID=67377 RepID=A0ABU6M8C3_9ACTN|nr:caspase family protein [Streptomyces violaceochromogenes]MEC7057653.1 caspase family protein [Streptomyces violaceochromogenes]